MSSSLKSEDKKELQKLAVYLRYFTLTPTATTKLHYRYKDIATMTSLSISQVAHFCLSALPGNEGRYGPRNRSRKHNLTEEQL